jgi:hypothetical protein
VTEGAPPAAGQADPAWLSAAWRAFANEQRLYFGTALAFTRDARSFGAEWGQGTLRALNPLGFALSSLGITGTYQVAVVRLLDGAPPDMPLWAELIKPGVPFVIAALMSLLLHLAVKLAGSPRPLRSTVALALYATGPMTAAMIVFTPIIVLMRVHPTSAALALIGMAGSVSTMVLYIVLTSRAASGLHQVKKRWPALALVAGYFSVMALVFFLNGVDPRIARWMTF